MQPGGDKMLSQEEKKLAFDKISHVQRKGVKPSEVAEYYDKWAEDLKYEKEIAPQLYTSPMVTATSSAECFDETMRGRVKVLDVAAGSGLCGVELSKLGFSDIDALDPSEGMLAEARKKNVYNKLICAFMNEQRQDIENGTYDLLTCSAGFGEGHIPSEAMNEMVRLTKPGGYMVIVTRAKHFETVSDYKEHFDGVVAKLERSGKLEQVERKIFPRFFLEHDGIILKYKVL